MRTPLAAGRLVGIVLVSGLGSACGSDPVDEVRHDLVAAFAGAEELRETDRLDFGSLDARSFLVSGWSIDEEAQAGLTFVWSVGEASEVRFYVVERRAIDFSMRAWALTPESLPEQRINVLVGGQTIGEVALRTQPASIPLTIPPAQLERGWNILRFEPAELTVPAKLIGSADTRRLGFAVDWMKFRQRAVAGTSVEASRDQLVLARGARLEYYLELAPGSTFSVASLVSRSENLRLEVSTQFEDEPARTMRLAASPGPVRKSLAERGGLARIALSVVGSGADAADGTMSLTAPRVRRPVERGRAAPSATEPRAGVGRLNVVLYVIDALRADRLGCYGDGRGLTPAIDRFAEQSLLFQSARAQSSWTKPSIASVLTGQHPWRHGANAKQEVLPADVPTLAGLFRGHGYRTAAVVANGFVSETFGFDRDFDSFDYVRRSPDLPERILERTAAWLATTPTPFFLYVHTIEPHAPYAAPDRWRRRFAPAVSRPEVGTLANVTRLSEGSAPPEGALLEDLEALYDAEVAHADERFGTFLEQLRAAGLGDDTIVILTSDHGESFYEHGTLTHGKDLYSEVLRIPLIVRIPGRAGERRAIPAQHLDLFPTLETLLTGSASSSNLDGRDLLQSPSANGPVFSYLAYSPQRRSASVVEGDWKLILPLDRGGGAELFDLSADPHESRSLAAEEEIRTGYLRSLLRMEMATLRRSDSVEIGDEVREQLEALGYLQ